MLAPIKSDASRLMVKMLPQRFFVFVVCLVLFALSLVMLWDGRPHDVTLWRWFAAVSGLLCAVGVFDMAQRKSTLRRNFPITAHFRTFFEYFRPMLRQYVVESD